MSYTPRLKPPAKNSKYYNNTSAGGYLTNIIGNYPYGLAASQRTGLPGWNVLPNCVGWCAGRWAELSGKNKLIYDFNTDAKNFIDLAKKFGLKTGKTPKLGAILVWKSKSSSGCGHVAVCEQINSSTEIVVSESGWSYKGTNGMWTATHKKGTDGNWISGTDENWMSGRYTFLGFIYHPDVEDEYPLTSTKFSFLNTTLTCSCISKDDSYYIRLRDLEEVLHFCAIGYYNQKPTLNGKYLDMSKLTVISQNDTNYIKVKELETVLKMCTVTYNATTKVVTIVPK